MRRYFSIQESKVEVMSDQEKRDTIIAELCVAYWMEMETVMNFIACSINLDGVRAEEIKSSLQADIVAEMNHAQVLAKRIKTIGGIVPGSASFISRQSSLQPPKKMTDVVSVIKGVIAAEDSAIAQYSKIIQLCDGFDYVTQDLCITALGDEEEHRREFMGFLSEYEG
jgi:bacterioferritin